MREPNARSTQPLESNPYSCGYFPTDTEDLDAAKNYGVNVLGVTFSRKQKAYVDEKIARAGFQCQVAVELMDYRDLGDESFDRVVNVGLFEHVGRNHLPEFFAQVYRLLKPNGLFLNRESLEQFVIQPAAI